MAAWSSELQAHRIAFPLWVFAFTLGFPTILPTNRLNPRKTPRYVIKRTKTRRTSNPLQHKGLEVLSRHEWVRHKSSHGFLVRMRSAVRIRPAAPERKPPDRVVFCFGKLRCGVEVYPRRGKSAQQLQQFPPKSKGFGGFFYIFATFRVFLQPRKTASLPKNGVLPTNRLTFWQMGSPLSLAAQGVAGF